MGVIADDHTAGTDTLGHCMSSICADVPLGNYSLTHVIIFIGTMPTYTAVIVSLISFLGLAVGSLSN